MPDEPKKTDDDGNPIETPVTGVPVEEVSSLVDSFKETIAEVRKANAAAAAVTPPPAAGPSKEELATAYNDARTKANELAAEGNHAEATELLFQAYQQLMAGEQTAPDDTPAYKAMFSQAKRTIKADNKEFFKQYDAEIEAEVALLSPEERINPDAWERALATVKTNHFDDILEAEREKLIKEAQAAGGFSPLVSPGSQGERDTDSVAANLSQEDRDFASRINFSPERYAKAKEAYEKNLIRPGSVNLLDEADGDRIKPGKF